MLKSLNVIRWFSFIRLFPVTREWIPIIAVPTRTILRTVPWMSCFAVVGIEHQRTAFARPPGGYFRNFSVGMCRWNPETLSLYQSWFSWILLPYTRVNPPNHSYSRVAVFHEHSLAKTKPYTTIVSLSKNDFIYSSSVFFFILNQLVSFMKNDTLF